MVFNVRRNVFVMWMSGLKIRILGMGLRIVPV
jgi:hypothetical protein